MLRLARKWLNKCKENPQLADELKASILDDSLAFSILNEILDEDIEAVRRTRCASMSYDQNGWDAKQAHLNGIEETLLKLKNLLDFEE